MGLGFLSGIFGSLSSKIALALGIITILTAGAGFLYFQYANHQIASLNKANATLAKTVNDDNNTITALQASAAQQALLVSQLQSSLSSADSTERALLSKINGTNINNIAQTDNKAASDILNKTSQDVINSIMAATTIVTPLPPGGKK